MTTFASCASSVWMVLAPPGAYIDKPIENLIVVYAPDPDEACRNLGAESDGEIQGCQTWLDQNCYLILPVSDDACLVEIVRQHGHAHCLGWKHQSQPFETRGRGDR